MGRGSLRVDTSKDLDGAISLEATLLKLIAVSGCDFPSTRNSILETSFALFIVGVRSLIVAADYDRASPFRNSSNALV